MVHRPPSALPDCSRTLPRQLNLQLNLSLVAFISGGKVISVSPARGTGADMRSVAKRIVVGRIAGVFGVKGWLKVMSYTSPRENILNYNPWFLHLNDTWREVSVKDRKTHNKGLTVAFEGVDDRDMARALIGADILVLRSQLGVLARGEYYQEDLLDMQVITREGKNLGQVKEIMETGANEVLVIEGQHRHLVPLVWNRYLLDIDQDKGVIRVDWEEPD